MLEALLKKKNNDGPFRYVYWVILVVFAALVARLVWLQLFQGDYYNVVVLPIASIRYLI